MDRIAHYELVRLIGRGGMGEVHEATDLKLRRRVALKFLSRDLTADAAALSRFEREAYAAADLQHPHIAVVYAFEPEGEMPFIAMELLGGPSLRDRIGAGPLPLAEALAIARDVATALAFAHRRGIAHRDIKPENLMFDDHGQVKVMDFGLARATMASKLTMTGTSLGTPAYMSPEAIQGESGPAADVFALGLTLYEMLAGQRAFPGDNVMAIMFAIANNPPPSIRSTRPDVPEEVEQLIGAMLAKDPAERIDAATAATTLAALTGAPAPMVSGPIAAAPVVTTHAVTAPLPPAHPNATTIAMTTSPRPTTTLVSWLVPPGQREHPVRFLSIAGGTLAALTLAATLFVSGDRQRTQHRLAEAERLQQLGTEAGRKGNVDEARALFWRALAVDPAQAGSLNNLGMMAISEQRYTAAESLFQAILAHHRDDPIVSSSALHNLAEIDFARNAYGRAITHLQQAFALDSSSADAYNNLGWALMKNGQSADALVMLDRGLKRFPGEAHLYKNAGLAARELGQYDRALRYLDTAVRLDSTYAEARELRDRTRQDLAR